MITIVSDLTLGVSIGAEDCELDDDEDDENVEEIKDGLIVPTIPSRMNRIK